MILPDVYDKRGYVMSGSLRRGCCNAFVLSMLFYAAVYGLLMAVGVL